MPSAWQAIDDVDRWLRGHAPPATDEPSSRRFVRARIGPALLAVLPVIVAEAYCGGWAQPLHAVAAIFIIANSLVRIGLPSSYCPRSQARGGWLAAPHVARSLATVAELAFYAAEAAALGLPFWAAPLGGLTLLGESLCWAHVLLQAELLGCLEDTVWTIYQAYALLMSTAPIKLVVCLPYVLNATVGGHLRRQYSRVAPPRVLLRVLLRLDVRELFRGGAPYWRAPPRIGTLPDLHVHSWSVQSLLAKPVTYALLRFAREPEDGGIGGGRALAVGALPPLVVLLLGAMWWEHRRGGGTLPQAHQALACLVVILVVANAWNRGL